MFCGPNTMPTVLAGLTTRFIAVNPPHRPPFARDLSLDKNVSQTFTPAIGHYARFFETSFQTLTLAGHDRPMAFNHIGHTWKVGSLTKTNRPRKISEEVSTGEIDKK